MNRLFLLVVAGSLVVLESGCLLMDSAYEMGRQTRRMFKFRPNDYRDTTDEESDEWEFVGEEGRGNQPIQRDPDRLWRELFMSEKARSIERNVGIE